VIVRRTSLDEIFALRHAVLRPGRLLETAAFDGDDEPSTVHLGAYDGGTLVCCATLMRRPFEGEDAGQLRGIATRQECARRGIGTAVVRVVEAIVGDEWRLGVVWCNGRTSALGFWARVGWEAVSAEFDIPDVGPHVRMVRLLGSTRTLDRL
jgi:predicted GNAT family N-acyltransferase